MESQAGSRRRLALPRMRLGLAHMPPRLSLLFLAMPLQILAEVLYWVYGRGGNLYIIGLTTALWLAWFAIILLICIPAVDDWLRGWLKKLQWIAAIVIAIVALIGIVELVGLHLLDTGAVEPTELTEQVTNSFRYNDATAISHQASEALLRGENPYLEADIVAALEALNLPPDAVTPLQQGYFADVFPYPTPEQLDEILNQARSSGESPPQEFESKVSYPAGSFLFQTPFLALGLKDLRIFYLICALLAAAVIVWCTPARLRLLVIAAFLSSIVLWNLIATGTTDTLYVLFLLIAWIFRRRLWLSALCMGLAVATKQIAWVYVLFYAILVLRETGWARMAKALAMTAVVFCAVNLPFVLGAPQNWLEGVMAPVVDPMFPKGVGLVTFSLAGVLPSNPMVFIIIEVAVLALAAGWYYFCGYRYPQSGLLLAVLPFFFAWRSYSCYFYFASLLVFGAVAAIEYSPGRKQESSPHLPVEAGAFVT